MNYLKSLCLTPLLILGVSHSKAQTDMDGLMMAKRNLCGGIVVGQSQWNHYWEGTLYRNNENIGTLTSQMAMAMANYALATSSTSSPPPHILKIKPAPAPSEVSKDSKTDR
jgi:hypothetical protein